MTKNHAGLNLSPTFCPPSSPSHLTSGSSVRVCSPFPASSFNPLQTAVYPHLFLEAAFAKLTSHFLISKAYGQLWALISLTSSVWHINHSFFQKHLWFPWPQVPSLLWPLFLHLRGRLLCLCLSSSLGPPTWFPECLFTFSIAYPTSSLGCVIRFSNSTSPNLSFSLWPRLLTREYSPTWTSLASQKPGIHPASSLTLHTTQLIIPINSITPWWLYLGSATMCPLLFISPQPPTSDL